MDEVTNFAYAKHREFRGLARVGLSDLQFDEDHTIFPQNVHRLNKIFQIEGCQRLDERNYIDVVATDSQLYTVQPGCLQDAPPKAWGSSPVLGVGPLKCLTGQHRVRAAQKYLDANDQWWVARVYSDNLSRSPCQRLAEEYLNEKPPSDGEIFYKIRQYHLANDEANELKWWARLTETKRKDLKQLLRDTRYANAFDSMLPWPGLWAPVKLGSLHRLLCLKCDEELFAYLDHISVTWRGITENTDTCDIVDVSSVEQLQGLAPYHSTVDAKTISDMISTDKIFKRVTDERERASILAKLLSIRNMIPSLFTFFEDIKYLEPCAKVLKALLTPGTKKSVSRGLTGSFFQQEKVLIEHGSKDLRIHSMVASGVAHALACQQLWLFAFRNFPLMTNFTTRKELDKDKPAAVEPSPCVWQEFAELASLIGFKTPAVDELRSRDSTKLIVAQLFERFTDPSSVEDSKAAEDIAAILGSLHRRKEPGEQPNFTNSDQLPILKRCGRPFEDDHRADRSCLYLPHVYRNPPIGANITTFYRKWNMFRVFMGIKDTPPDIFLDDVTVDSGNGETTPANENEGSDRQTENDRMVETLKRQVEQHIGEMRAAQSEHERAVGLFREEIRTEAQDKDGLRRKLRELEVKLQEAIEEKCNLVKELQEANGDKAQTYRENEAMVRNLKAALEDERTSASSAHISTIDHIKGDLATKYERIQSLELELGEKAAALASYETKHAELQSSNSKVGEQLSDLQKEHRIVRQANDEMTREASHLDEAIRKSAAQARKDEEKISKLESDLGEASKKIIELGLQALNAEGRILGLEQKLMEARECVETQAQAVDQEQDIRYDAEVAVMNQKIENAMTREVTRRILEELDQANNRGKEVEGKMKALETRLQHQNSASTGLTLVTWERVGETSFTKIYFTCQKEDALQCVRSLELCSQENCSKWDYIGFDRRRIPSSMKQDEKYLIDVWIQGGIMGRWLVADRSFFEARSAQRADMPTWIDRPKLTLKRKSPGALDGSAGSSIVKRSQPLKGRIEEI